ANLCDLTKDPCQNSSSMYEGYLRSKNCPFNKTLGLCDRYLDTQWYKTEGNMLNYCPSLHSCGAEYPLWLNESIPTVSDGVVIRKVCKQGAGDCCVKTYSIRIKNCTSFVAYCLVPAETCSERYCFGENGTCELPPQLITNIESTTAGSAKMKTIRKIGYGVYALVAFCLQVSY
ncbi:oncoprotein-induced transcript 3 protein-like, partial [Saccostrea cucullata]|uniref:oncoprotein-induced transcript 3 protein-like n=1 Tax=Saccostrea cuccullata TaxID=36930 RepID=UPI002ED4A92E